MDKIDKLFGMIVLDSTKNSKSSNLEEPPYGLRVHYLISFSNSFVRRLIKRDKVSKVKSIDI